MKSILIVCKPSGIARLTTSDLHISEENLASIMTLDFSEILGYEGQNKWVDFVMDDGTSLRYDLGVGVDDVVEFELTHQLTIPGPVIVTPIIWDGVDTTAKMKWKVDQNLLITDQPEAGNYEAIQRDDFIWELAEEIRKIKEGEYEMDVNIIGSEVAIDVVVQDQVSPAIIAKFKKKIAQTVSAIITTINGNDITVSSPTGFSIGKYVTVISPSDVRFYLGEIVAVNGSVITLDAPFDFVYPVGSIVSVADINMAVNGSATTQIFCIRGDEDGVNVAYDVTRIMIAGLCATAPDLSKFGDLTKLTYGLVLRRVDGTTKNIFNVKSNSELRNIMYDFELSFADNPSHGQDGFNGRITFAGQNKMGVAIRLAPGDDLEILIQDDLTGLTSLEIIAEGHLVVD